eukprot:TRINITY_DN2917_c0_g2_i3.p1 TRINITY_DN2917_c0_g2~~TRINITY_DN2917_c0_g2_i3.p1  ORF type:complete len:449 (-),score=82.80 TRINITY_DN2917_c0_g2_i3:67-1413(-)
MVKEDFEKYKAAKKKEVSAASSNRKKRQPNDGLKFPVTTIEINGEYSKQVCSISYLEVDFLTLLATSSLILFLITQIINIYDKDAIKDINFAFSLEFFTVVFALYFLLKLAFEDGFFRTDEARLGLFFGTASSIAAFTVLYVFPEYFDLCFPAAYQTVKKRINEAFSVFGINFNIGYKYFCILLAAVAFLLTMAQTTHAVSFAYYYHSLTKQNYERAPANSSQLSSKLYALNLHLTFIFPLLLIILYVPALAKDYLAPAFISDRLFEVARTLLIFLYAVMKLVADRREFQWKMFQAYAYIKALPQNVNDQYYNLMSNQLLKRLKRVWAVTLGYISCAIIPILMSILLLHKGIYLLAPERVESFDFSFLYSNATNTTEPEKVKMNPFEVENLSGILGEVNKKGIVPSEFYRGLFGFVAFWWMASHFAISMFTLIYYRRFRRVPLKYNSD